MTGPLVLFGAGRMGGALLQAWVRQGLDGPVTVVDPHPADWLTALGRKGSVSLNPESVPIAGTLVLAVKPQFMSDVLVQAQASVGADTLVLSVAAGTRIDAIRAGCGGRGRHIRVMPNTPALVGKGMSVLCAEAGIASADRQAAERLFAAVGKTAWLANEDLMDAVTAVSGSGPAYVFLLTETLASAGVEQGLEADLALELAMATVAGAGEMMWQGQGAPDQLRVNVTSPGGTTAAALDILMADPGMKALLSNAVAAATKRGKELGS